MRPNRLQSVVVPPVAAIIPRFGGFIARYVGDGVLIYFGWPEAHEANAERAVRAALAVIDAIAQAPVLTESLQVRIRIATGLQREQSNEAVAPLLMF